MTTAVLFTAGIPDYLPIFHSSKKWYEHHDDVIKWKLFPRYRPFVRGFTGEFPSQRPVTQSFDVIFDLRLNKRLSKQSRGWCFETPSCTSWRHCNDSFNHEYKAMRIINEIKALKHRSVWDSFRDCQSYFLNFLKLFKSIHDAWILIIRVRNKYRDRLPWLSDESYIKLNNIFYSISLKHHVYVQTWTKCSWTRFSGARTNG